MRATCLALTAILLAGCVRLPGRRADLDQLVGQSDTLVARVMGVPDRSFEAGGHRFLAYVERHQASFAGYDMYDGYGRYGRLGYRRLGFEASPELYERTCETTFELEAGRVLSYTLRGNACDLPRI
jgi:hypothetical protein